MPNVLAKKYTITDAALQGSEIDEMFDDLYRQLQDTNVSGSALGAIGSFIRVATATTVAWSTLILPNAAVKGSIPYASATDTLSMLADIATGNALISGGVGLAPSWGKIGLTTHVSGTLPLGNGGTGATSFAAGSIPFSDGSVLTEDNSKLFFDDANNRLGMGTITPAFAIDLRHTGTRSQIHFNNATTDVGGYLTALASNIVAYTGGAAWSAAWFANVADCAGMFFDAGSIKFTADSGLAFPGVAFTPTVRGQIWPSGAASFFGTMADPGAGVFGIEGNVLLTGTALLKMKPGTRTYTWGPIDASGALAFSRNDVAQSLYIKLNDTTATISTANIGGDLLAFELTSGAIAICPGAGGAAGQKVQIGRRVSDDSAAVGAILEVWPDNAETLPLISTMAPGGATRRFQVSVDADIVQGRDNAQSMNIKSLTELTTIAAAATTDTTIQFPANCVPLGVSVRVTVVIPTAATFDVGDAATPTLFNAGLSTAANTTGYNPPSAYTRYTAGTKVRITPNAVPAANTGRVRVTLHYLDLTAPTS